MARDLNGGNCWVLCGAVDGGAAMIQIMHDSGRFYVTPTECSISSLIMHGPNTEYMKTLRDLLLHGY